MTINADDVLDIIAKEGLVPRENVKVESRLDELNIPSLEMINVLFALEDEFGVVIDDDELKPDQTIGDLIAMVEARLAEKSA